MAYALAFTNTNSSTDVGVNPSSSSVTTAGSFLRFEIEFADFDSEQRVYARNATTQTALNIIDANTITHRFGSTSAATFTLPFTLQPNTRYVFEIKTGAPATVKINDITVRTVSNDSSGGGLNWTHFGSGTAGFRPVRGKLYWIETSGASGALRFQNLTGAGLELTEQNFGAAPITLTGNWPSDNSQWVLYDDGGAITATTAFTMPQFSVSASASNSVPVFTAESAFTMPQFSVAAQAGIDAGQITAAASFVMPQFSVSAATSNSVPVFSGSASFTMPQFTVAAQASSIASGVGASVSFFMPQFTVAANAESSLPDYIASAAFTMPQFTVQVVSGDAFPTVNARALFKMPQFTVESETRNELFNPPGTYIQPTNNPNIYII